MASAWAFAALAATTRADDLGIDASKCLDPRMQVAQEFGNIFSRTVAFHVKGFDDLVKRVSGTAAYKVLEVSPQQVVLDTRGLFDGLQPASHEKYFIKDGGRTTLSNGHEQPLTDASGVSINPMLWGAPRGTLHVGDTWEVQIPIPWELGPAGKQTVKVVAIDPLNDGITLQREGASRGEFADDIKTLPLIKDRKTYRVDVTPSEAKWNGYTTFQRGMIMSDVLIVVRQITVTSKELGQSTGTERQYILLNATSPSLLNADN